ncbi:MULTISPECIES: hypothetical protein [Burkholderia]|uniref:hypothetical protein n=1 Tax=Burkholderia TaxID=32008 RepID=UPI0012F4F3C4|nr:MULTISPECIES: hypothetical protein [Burkholderia]
MANVMAAAGERSGGVGVHYAGIARPQPARRALGDMRGIGRASRSALLLHCSIATPSHCHAVPSPHFPASTDTLADGERINPRRLVGHRVLADNSAAIRGSRAIG